MGQEDETPPSTFSKRLGKAMLWALRMFLVVVLGIAVGIAGYVGGQWVYQHYWEPVPVHEIRLDILEGHQKQTAEQLAQQRAELQGRVDVLEMQNDGQKLALDELRERLVAIETPQAAERARLDAAYAELEQLQEALAGEQAMQDAFLATLEDLQAADAAGHADSQAQQLALAELEQALETAQGELTALQARVADLSAQAETYGLELAAVNQELTGPRSPLVLQRELQRVVAMQWLTRARLVLVQNNLGLAQVDLLAARRVLVALQADLPLDQGALNATQIAQVIERLDAALANLPAAPVAAADELEGAWQLLVAGLLSEAEAVPASEATPEAALTSEATSTAEATPEAASTSETTPTAEATPTPEATPTVEATPTTEASPTPTPTPTPAS